MTDFHDSFYKWKKMGYTIIDVYEENHAARVR